MKARANGFLDRFRSHGQNRKVMENFWPRHLALAMNAYLITHPDLAIQPWFEALIELRLSQLSRPRRQVL